MSTEPSNLVKFKRSCSPCGSRIPRTLDYRKSMGVKKPFIYRVRHSFWFKSLA